MRERERERERESTCYDYGKRVELLTRLRRTHDHIISLGVIFLGKMKL